MVQPREITPNLAELVQGGGVLPVDERRPAIWEVGACPAAEPVAGAATEKRSGVLPQDSRIGWFTSSLLWY